jgi:hypothetical protein
LKSRRSLAAVVLAILAALVLAIPANAAQPLLTLEANLAGEKEVPGPGDPDGSGHAVVNVYRAQVCYGLEVANIAPSTAAHIHLGFRSEAGPVLVSLNPPTDGSSGGCAPIPRALSQGLREHPARYYVNVHNEEFPNGAIRGQLHRM